MFSQERRDQILKLLQEESRVLAKELAERFQVSIDSIRRDLSIMEEEQLLRRTHGGAIPWSKVRRDPGDPSIRYGEGSVYQNAIARKAASYIQENETVFIGGAAIHYVMLKYLSEDFHFTVVTNSIRTADLLKDRNNMDTYLLGGRVKRSGNITDSMAMGQAAGLMFDLCFATGGGCSVRGLSTTTPEVAQFGRIIAENSRKVIGLAEHDKIGADSFAQIIPLTRLSLLITDEEAAEEHVKAIEGEGIRVIIAK
ncbi:DeoR/GlpR family DNA-binding transcription regulator [Neobacillus mesonae]|nr:DeoR/GlpR family DNA-binding transcription regulator [Neobacillus mesonae]